MPPAAVPETVEALLSEMRWCGIKRALVYHALAREYDPAVGNRTLLEQLGEERNLFPCFVLLPPATGEMSFDADLRREMREAGARAARLFPKHHSYSLHPRCSGRLLEWLEAERIPLLVDLEQTDWEEVAAVCGAFPALALILLRAGYRVDRQVYPLLEAHPNLHLEISYYQSHRAVEEVVSRFGAGRLMFGTGYPFFAPAAAVAAVNYAQISPGEKALIASGNLEALLGLGR